MAIGDVADSKWTSNSGEILLSLIRLSISLCVVKKLNGLEHPSFEKDFSSTTEFDGMGLRLGDLGDVLRCEAKPPAILSSCGSPFLDSLVALVVAYRLFSSRSPIR
jgi:hypothetical protein